MFPLSLAVVVLLRLILSFAQRKRLGLPLNIIRSRYDPGPHRIESQTRCFHSIDKNDVASGPTSLRNSVGGQSGSRKAESGLQKHVVYLLPEIVTEYRMAAKIADHILCRNKCCSCIDSLQR